jgi:hypothetical protein
VLIKSASDKLEDEWQSVSAELSKPNVGNAEHQPAGEKSEEASVIDAEVVDENK